MRSNKRRSLQPLNFTPDEPPKGRTAGEERTRGGAIGPTPKPVSLRAPEPEPDVALGLSPATRRGPPDLGLARYVYLFASIAAFAWAGMLLAYTIGYVGGVAGLVRAPMQLAVVAAMALLPAVFVFAGAYALRQGARLAAEARWTRTLAEDLVAPAALAAARTGDIAAGVRLEVERASAAAIAAHGQMVSVREALAGETDRLGEAVAQAQHTARAVGETLTRERDALSGLVSGLTDASDILAAGVERQSRLVGEASDLARSQLQEAEATLASGAQRLAAASTDAGAAARQSGEELTRQAERLDVAAAAVSERLRFLDARLADQRSSLSGLLQTLDTDQEDLAARLETQRAQMLDVIGEARASVQELGGAAAAGGEALQSLILTALEQTREVAATARSEQGQLRGEAVEARLEAQNELHRALDALARAGEDARRSLASSAEQAQVAATERLGAARAEVEQLGELAFTAGQRADHSFQARLGEARRMIEQTAALVEDAGQRAGERIEVGLGASRGALGDLAAALGDIDGQLAHLPQAAREHAEAVRAGVEGSLNELTASARRAAEETKALDAAFQDRIRRNYEALSEAVRLMSRVTGAVELNRDLAPSRPAPPPAAAAPASPPAAPPPQDVDPFASLRRPELSPAPRPSTARPEPAPAAERKPSSPRLASPVFGRAASREPEAAQALGGDGPADLLLEPARAAQPGETEAGLRPRLKFTPTPADEALKAVFARPEPEAATGGRDAPGRGEWDADLDEWTWKDLLTSMDDGPTDTDALADQMIREIETLGVDTAALLPPARVADIAAAMTGGDASAARDVVRRLAPAAIRRLSRRVLTDRVLREQVERYIERYQTLLREAAAEGQPARGAMALLGSDAGRAYLLLDAAVGDL